MEGFIDALWIGKCMRRVLLRRAGGRNDEFGNQINQGLSQAAFRRPPPPLPFACTASPFPAPRKASGQLALQLQQRSKLLSLYKR
jgi:hypothetical protein